MTKNLKKFLKISKLSKLFGHLANWKENKNIYRKFLFQNHARKVQEKKKMSNTFLKKKARKK